MSSQMDVLYLKSANKTFNHVLAIFTRTSEPPKLETDATAFVGDGLVLREFQEQDLIVPASEIGLFSVPLNSSGIASPRSLYASAAPGQTDLSQLSSFTNPVFTPSFTKPSKLTIPLASATPVLILVEGPSIAKPQPQSATVGPGSTDVTLTGLVAGNNYFAVIFAPMYPIVFLAFST